VTDVLPTSAGQQNDLQADLAKAKKEIAGPVPLIQDAADSFLTLPRGLHHNGAWQRSVEVRELTGMDEEALAKVRDVTDFYDTVLALSVTRIGDLDLGSLPLIERQGHLQNLLIGERDQIFVAAVKATYGDRKTLRYTCPSCNEEQDLILTLSQDFRPKEVGDITATTYQFTTSKGVEIQYRLATGSDQLEVMRRKGASPAEQNSIMLSRCLVNAGGQLVVDPLNYARSLSMRDRGRFLGELFNHQPSIDLTVTVPCVACREEQAVSLGWGDLFRL
jgi:hypothetical protein